MAKKNGKTAEAPTVTRAAESDRSADVLRLPAEVLFADQLEALRQNEADAAPLSWKLSPRSVLAYVIGGKTLDATLGGKKQKVEITRKFFGDTAIVEQVLREGAVSVEALARGLGVSLSTVRRDLAQLERQGLVRRTHGGAEAASPLLYEPFRHDSSFQEQEGRHAGEKRGYLHLVRDGEFEAVVQLPEDCSVNPSLELAKELRGLFNYDVLRLH